MREAESGRIALGEVALLAPDLVILDIGLPDTLGTEVLRAMRPIYSAPVLVLSVLGNEKGKIAALDAGADDYLTKPFSGGELLARLRALLRRIQPTSAVGTSFSFGSIQVDFEQRRVLRDGHAVKLTSGVQGTQDVCYEPRQTPHPSAHPHGTVGSPRKGEHKLPARIT